MATRVRLAHKLVVVAVAIIAIITLAPVAEAATTVTASLVQTIRTSDFDPPAPDTSGVVYNPNTDRILVADSEVEEMPIYNNVQVWEVNRATGQMVRGFRAPSAEPTGLALDPATNRLFFSDDNALRIYVRRAGNDGSWGTSDDSLTSFSTSSYSTDPEDVAYDSDTGDLFISDGVGKEVYRVGRGNDGNLGTSDDVITHFDVGQFGAQDNEGIEYDATRQSLLVLDYPTEKVYEVTKTGALMTIIDVSAANSTLAADIAIGPGSTEPGRRNLWIVARGVDNGADPNENDGRLYEMRVDMPSVNTAPSVSISSPTNGASFLQGSSVTFTGTASDAQQGTLTSGLVWTSNLDGQIGTGGSFATTTLSVGTHTVTAAVTDNGGLTGSATRTVTITAPPANTPPSVTISAPLNNATFLLGTPIQFTGSATDTQDGDLTNGLVWTSNISGQIGTGGSFSRSDLAAGTHTITASVTDEDGLAGSATRTIVVNDTATLTIPIATGSDDAEEAAGGAVDLVSTDLELVQDATTQVVGLRFAGVGLPAGASIQSSYVQFNVDETSSEATSLLIRGQAAANPGTFTTAANNVSSRAVTSASAAWSPAAWTKMNQHGAAQQTPSLNGILQELVGQSGWASGNSVVLIVTGTGRRVADSFEGGSSRRPVLHVTFRIGGASNTAPAVSISSPSNGASFVEGTSVQFTGTATDTQDGNLTSSLVWTSSRDGQIGTGGSFTKANLTVGTHTITASATDSGTLTGSATRTITITQSTPQNTAPTVSISSPADGSSVVQGTSVQFTGTASDTQDGNLTSSLVWTSSRDGQIGTGGSFTTSNLTVGTHTITASATDTGNLTGTATRTITVTAPGGTQVLNIPIAAGADDAEEYSSGSMVLDSTDLELVQESSTQKVGLRFNVPVPQGATIVAAYVQFTTDEVSTAATNLTIRCQASDNAPAFTASSSNISSRTLGSAGAAWTPAAWNTVGQAGVDQRTPSLNAVIQQVVGRAGWASGNALAIVITGSGKRVASAFESGGGLQPVLHIEYQV